MNEDLIEKIENYLNGEMTESEKIVFENDINVDKELKRNVQFLRSISPVAKKHAKEELKKKLSAIEEALPQEEWDSEKAASEGLGRKWRYLAIAASIVLVVGLFFFYNWHNNDVKQQLASKESEIQRKKDSLELENKHTYIPILAKSIPIKEVGDAPFGFAKSGGGDSLTLIIIGLNGAATEPLGKFKNDTIYFSANNTTTSFEVVRINKNNHLRTPNSDGIYLMCASELIFKIPNSDSLVHLSAIDFKLKNEIIGLHK